MKKWLLIALCVGLLIAMGLCMPALAADHEMTTDGKLFSGQLTLVQLDPEENPDDYGVEGDQVWFTLDKPSKVDFAANYFGDPLRGRLWKLESDDEGEWADELYWLDVDYRPGYQALPKKIAHTAYLHPGRYYFEIWADWYGGQPINLKYNLSVTASAIAHIQDETDDVLHGADVRPITLPASIDEALLMWQYQNIYRFNIAQQSMVDVTLTGKNNTWVGMQVVFAEPGQNEGDETITYDIIYDNDAPMYGEVAKPVVQKHTMFLMPGTYYIAVFRPEDWLGAPYNLAVTAKAMPTAKLKVPKKMTIVQGASTRMPLFGNAYDFGSGYEITSSDPSVAFNDGGAFIKALKVGTAKLTVAINGQSKKANCTVKVVPNAFSRKKPLSGKEPMVYLSAKSLQFTGTGVELEVFVLNKTKAPISALTFENFHLRLRRQNMHTFHADYGWDELTNSAKQPLAFAAPIAPGKYGTFKLSMKPHYENPEDIQPWEYLTPDEINLTVSSDCVRELNGVQYFTDATIKGLKGGIPGAKLLTGKEKTSFIDEKAIFAAAAK